MPKCFLFELSKMFRNENISSHSLKPFQERFGVISTRIEPESGEVQRYVRTLREGRSGRENLAG